MCCVVNVIYFSLIPYRNKRGRVVKPAPFQGKVKSGEVARVEPNKKWFGEH